MRVINLPPIPEADDPYLQPSWKRGTAMYGGRHKKRLEEAEKAAIAAPEVPKKGTCRHCGTHIGVGIWMHEQHCQKKMAAAAAGVNDGAAPNLQ